MTTALLDTGAVMAGWYGSLPSHLPLPAAVTHPAHRNHLAEGHTEEFAFAAVAYHSHSIFDEVGNSGYTYGDLEGMADV